MIAQRSRTFIAGAALSMLGLVGGSIPALADSLTILSVQTGHSVVLNADGLTRVAVGDGRIAGVVPIGTSQLVVNGKAPGHTTIFVWNSGHRNTYEVTVTEQSVDDVSRVIRAAVNEPDVQVISFNQNIIVRGTVPDQAGFVRLQDLLGRFKGLKVSGQDATLVNAVTVAHPLGSIQMEMNSMPGTTNIRLDPDAKGNVIVSGNVHDRAGAEAVLDRARGLAGPYLAAEGKVVDRLAVETTSQVDVKVYVLEVDHTATSQLGINLQAAQLQSVVPGTNQATYTLGPPQFVGIEQPAKPTTPGHALNIGQAFFRVSLLAPTLNLLLQEGHARVLSSPNLVTKPGEEATFLVGGELPIPVSSGLGQTAIMFKEFGVKLNVTPTLLGNGNVDTKISPEVSDLDFQDGISINGFVIPALKTSKLSTNIITQSGESIVMGGLLKHQEQRFVDKIPLFGDIPVLGKLFRSTRYQKLETDVVFIMTPTVITR